MENKRKPTEVAQPEQREKGTIEVDDFYALLKQEADPEMTRYLKLAIQIAELVRDHNGIAMVTGGFTRDQILNQHHGYDLQSKDIDFEIYGIPKDELEKLLSGLGKVKKEGKQFECFLVKGPDFLKTDELIDVALPRTEINDPDDPSHRGLKTVNDPYMNFCRATLRRDLTIGAIAMDPLNGKVIDVFGGLNDLRDKKIRMVSEETFADDPLRPFRVAQFAGRLGFGVEQKTREFCWQVDQKHLPPKRIVDEWSKLFCKSPKPSVGLDMARRVGVIEQVHPELDRLIGIDKAVDQVPEDSYQAELGQVLDQGIEIARRENLSDEDIEDMMFALLCKDLGQDLDKFMKKIEIKAKGQADRKAKIGSFIKNKDFLSEHPEISDTSLRRLSLDLGRTNIAEFVNFLEALEQPETIKKIVEAAKRLNVLEGKPKELIAGGELIKIGFKPGRELGQAKQRIYQAQLDGEVNTVEEALSLAEKLLKIM